MSSPLPLLTAQDYFDEIKRIATSENPSPIEMRRAKALLENAKKIDGFIRYQIQCSVNGYGDYRMAVANCLYFQAKALIRCTEMRVSLAASSQTRQDLFPKVRVEARSPSPTSAFASLLPSPTSGFALLLPKDGKKPQN